MKKHTILYILIALLVVVNGYFIAHHFSHSKRKKGGDHHNHRNYIVKKLGFDEAQTAQFKALNDKHYQDLAVISDSMRVLKEKIYATISESDMSKSDVDSILKIIGDYEQQKEVKRFYHFKAIGELCDAEQKEQFKSMLMKAVHRKRDRSSKGHDHDD